MSESEDNTAGIEITEETKDLNAEKVRKLYVDLIRETLEKYPRFVELENDKKARICRKMERSCMNKVVKYCTDNYIQRFWTNKRFIDIYSAEIYRHLSNLSPDSFIGSEYYASAILDGKFSPAEIADLDTIDLCPEASIEARKIIQERKNSKVVEKFTDKHPCPFCKSKKVTYIEVLRSLGADEITSFKYTCCNCRRTW